MVVILALGFTLRAYRITGWILNNDETHFLIQALSPRLLITNDYPHYYGRPDCFYVLLQMLTVPVLGPNELALKIWTVLFGTLSIVAMAHLVRLLTNSWASALWAAAWLAVFPLHVFFSTKVTPEVIAVFFLICCLIQFVHIWRGETSSFRFLLFGSTMALAIFSKLTSVAFWFCLLISVPLVVPDNRARRWACFSLMAALLPVLGLGIATKLNGGRIHFFEETNAWSSFGFDLSRIVAQLGSFWRFYAGLLISFGLGAWVLIRKRREAGPLMVPLVLTLLSLLIAVPFFRVTMREMVFVIPAIWPLLGFSVNFFSSSLTRAVALGSILIVHFLLALIGVPGPEYGLSWGDRSTAVLDRPPGWPSRAITEWMAKNVSDNDGLLVTGFGYTDPLVLALRQLGIRYHSATSNWELLRDPANKIRYVLFVDDASRYAPTIYRYAQRHFTRIYRNDFTGYMLFDCQKRGRFVAYPDALNTPTVYVNEGFRLAEHGEYSAAVDHFLVALRQDNSMYGAKKMLMSCYLALGQKRKATQIGRELIVEHPRDPEVSRNLIILYYDQGMFGEAVAQCRTNIDSGIFPGLSYGVMGQSLERLGKWEAARDAYNQSLKLEPGNPVTQELVARFRAAHPQLY